MTYYYPIIIPIQGDGAGITAENTPVLFYTTMGILIAVCAVAIAFIIYLIIIAIKNF